MIVAAIAEAHANLLPGHVLVNRGELHNANINRSNRPTTTTRPRSVRATAPRWTRR